MERKSRTHSDKIHIEKSISIVKKQQGAEFHIKNSTSIMATLNILTAAEPTYELT
jgi:hypothetical protein